jgi:HEAT repeat protein
VRKRWLVGLLVVLACALALILVFPATVYVPLGKLRHEAFFDGKPTSYWVRAFRQEGFLVHPPPSGDVGKTLREGGAAAVPVLREIAAYPDQNLRSEALGVLALLGPDARDATPELAAAVKAEDNSSRFMLACEALAGVDPATAAETLGEVLRDKTNDGRRSWALTELLKLAPQGREALPGLKEMVNDPKAEVVLRVQAMRMLWRLKEPAEPLVAALVEVVTADQSPAGVQALEALGEMGPDAKPALPVLLKLLQDRSIPLSGKYWGPPHRAAVIHAIGGIGPEARTAVPLLLDCLKTKDYAVRMEVAMAVANMGPPVKEMLAVRDAVFGASITLLAAQPLDNLATAPLLQVAVRTWVPQDEHTVNTAREAVLRVDPDISPRIGGPR